MSIWEELVHLVRYTPEEPLLFHHGFFLFIFSAFLIGYSFLVERRRWQHVLLIAFSAYFYYKSSGALVLLLLTTISADYLISYFIEKQTSKRAKNWILGGGILFSLSFLFYFKYTNFFLENWAAVSGGDFEFQHIILPIGISFYTFQSISYLVDVARGDFKRPPFHHYLMYMMFFPHLVAGPIVRARDFLPQLDHNPLRSRAHLGEAFFLITKGIVKKGIVADYIAQYADNVFSAPSGFAGSEQALASLCYTLQIFCDFSGYTDMAIGIALLLGYRLSLNFDSPYRAGHITEFWRKWHISLSSWLRDYVYIPLGGNQKGFVLQLLFLLVTMLVGGLWHGADWKFVFWGGAHGLLLVFHKLSMRIPFASRTSGGLRLGGWFITFLAVNLLWIPFRAESMADAWVMYEGIFSSSLWNPIGSVFASNPLLPVLLVGGFALTGLPRSWKERALAVYLKCPLALHIGLLAGVIEVMLQVRTAVVQPFIYFQF